MKTVFTSPHLSTYLHISSPNDIPDSCEYCKLIYVLPSAIKTNSLFHPSRKNINNLAKFSKYLLLYELVKTIKSIYTSKSYGITNHSTLIVLTNRAGEKEKSEDWTSRDLTTH